MYNLASRIKKIQKSYAKPIIQKRAKPQFTNETMKSNTENHKYY